ncbi:MAG: hypothetical protein J6S67_20855 [Methanobrevibacter sp.]|nr:hypothetical protein [Methanobrevibacter sp.]
MYYTIIDNSILTADTEDALTRFYENVLLLPADYEEGKYIVVDGELVLNPDWEDEQAAKREADFKSKFFDIEGFGWFRKVPKGYSSAVECLNLAFNNVSMLGKLPAETLIFYQEPDFTKPEECTEEWLIEHQTKNAEMTVQEFGQFYAGFSVAWNNTEHN